MPQVDLFVDTVALPQSAEKRKTVHSVMKIICREKKKQLAVLDTCNDHENYAQHLYRFFFSLERFSYDLEMFMCEQNANNRLNEHTQTRAGFDWSCEHAMFSSQLKVIFC